MSGETAHNDHKAINVFSNADDLIVILAARVTDS
jgi:hypothetical protein